MYGVSASVGVKAVEANKRIRVELDDPPRTLERLFAPRVNNVTLVGSSAPSFHGSGADVTTQSHNSNGGITIVLASLKILLDQNIILNLVEHQYPNAHREAGAKH